MSSLFSELVHRRIEWENKQEVHRKGNKVLTRTQVSSLLLMKDSQIFFSVILLATNYFHLEETFRQGHHLFFLFRVYFQLQSWCACLVENIFNTLRKKPCKGET